MSSEYFPVLIPNLLKKQPLPCMVFQFFPLTWCSVFWRVGLVQAEVLVCCSCQVLKPLRNERCAWESLSWGIISFSCVSAAVEISAEPQWKQSCFLSVPAASALSTELLQFPNSSWTFVFFRMRTLLLSKFLQLDFAKSGSSVQSGVSSLRSWGQLSW